MMWACLDAPEMNLPRNKLIEIWIQFLFPLNNFGPSYNVIHVLAYPYVHEFLWKHAWVPNVA